MENKTSVVEDSLDKKITMKILQDSFKMYEEKIKSQNK